MIQGTVCNQDPYSLWCGGVCIPTGNDKNNCGFCGHVCASGTVCDGFQCILKNCNGLAGGEGCELHSDGGVGACCGGKCLAIESDPQNCGSCGNACTSAELCQDAQCAVTSCAGAVGNRQACTDAGGIPGICCSGACLDLSTDTENCGSCGHACAAGETCVGNDCILGSCPADGGAIDVECALSDGGGRGNCCADSCLDLISDPTNCGVCGTICSGYQICLAGGCYVVDCTTPEAGGQSCINDSSGELGTCCEGACVEGTSNTDCGGCGVVCPQGASCGEWLPDTPASSVSPAPKTPVGTQCLTGSNTPIDCQTAVCPPGFACGSWGCFITSCDGGSEGDMCLVGDLAGVCCGGACVDASSSHDHCGFCANNCGPAGACSSGRCTATSACTLSNDNASCAGSNGELGLCCQGSCTSPSGQASCDVTACLPGETGATCAYGDGIIGYGQPSNGICCDGVCTAPSSSESCGGCGITCSSTVCSGSSGECLPTGPYDGGSCEFSGPFCGLADGAVGECCGFDPRACADITDDPTNCGGCGQVCPVGQTCVSGQCSGSLPECLGEPGKYCDVDGGGDHVCCGGACVDITADPDNCGVCGYSCPAGGVCLGGSCALAACPADAGADVEQACAMADGGTGGCCPSGCAAVGYDPANCARCGDACGPTQVCLDFQCQ